MTMADRISNFNRHYAEPSGYWTKVTSFVQEIDNAAAASKAPGSAPKPIQFYDSVTGKPLFVAPVGRSFEDWKKESLSHGWPSFRDNEVNASGSVQTMTCSF